MAQRLDPAFVKAQFELAGYEMLGTYINKSIPIKFRCDKGHEHQLSYGAFRSGHRCGVCSGRYVSQLDVKKAFENEGFTLLGEYKNATEKIDFICSNKHKHSILWSAFNRGQRCGVCRAGYLTDEYIKKQFALKGFIVLSIYKKAIAPLKCLCPKGHEILISWNNFSRGKGCAYCSKKKITEETVREHIESQEYKLLSSYKSAHQLLDIECQNGHKTKIKWANFKAGNRCSICFEESVSYDYIKNPPKTRIIESVKRNIKKMKLDTKWQDYYSSEFIDSLAKELLTFYCNSPRKVQIDHIVPVSWFDLLKKEELIACWNINNLRYLGITENIKRSNRMTLEEIDFMKANFPDIIFKASRMSINIGCIDNGVIKSHISATL